jgi:hypothetical protein
MGRGLLGSRGFRFLVLGVCGWPAFWRLWSFVWTGWWICEWEGVDFIVVEFGFG